MPHAKMRHPPSNDWSSRGSTDMVAYTGSKRPRALLRLISHVESLVLRAEGDATMPRQEVFCYDAEMVHPSDIMGPPPRSLASLL